MKNSRYPRGVSVRYWLIKSFVIMKLAFIILLVSCLQVAANGYGQTKITLNLKSVALKKALSVIEKNSSYRFLYSERQIPAGTKVDIHVKDEPVLKVVDQILNPTDLSYRELKNNLLVIVEKNETIRDLQIKGRITDKTTGKPLPGVTIKIKGSNAGTVTDENGDFSLNVPDNAVLVVSFISYETREVAVNDQTLLNIALQPSSTGLNEVVVVGYSSQKKIDLTGAVSVIDNKDINDIPVGGVDQIMQGKAAGVAITQQSGAPGDAIAVRIRGVGTINDNTPLYVIDGIPTKDGINEISPDDIESISILKDASSAAIYGARASNGVVIITTKRGKAGKAKLSFSDYTGVQTPEHLIKMANTNEYVKAFNTAAQADGRPLIPAGMLDTLPNVNWLKEVLKPALVNNTQLSVSGGNENSTYIVSGNYFRQEGLIKNSGYQRFNIRTAINSNLSKMFTFGTNINLAYSKTSQVGSSGDGYGNGNPGASVVRYALFRTPATPVYNKSGQFVDLPNPPDFFGDGLNPVGFADAFNWNTNTYTVLGDAFLEFSPVKGLKIKTDIGMNLVLTDYKQFFKTWGIDRFFNSPNSLAQSNSNELNYNWTNTASYDLNIGSRNVFNFLAGTEAIKDDVKAFSASRKNYVDQTSGFQYLDNGLGAQQNGGNESHWALFSLFGRVNYAYAGKYLASFNVRRDGSSRLSPAMRYGDFYSGSAGWRIDQEEFMKNIEPVSLLKLRASIGQLGNQEIGNYSYTSLISGGFYYPFGGSSAQGYTVTSEGYPNIKWETSTQTDIGLDLGLFDNALLVTADYFIKNTSNMLLNAPIPSSAGSVASPFVNAGAVRNNGLELEITYHNRISKKITYELTGNFATLHNEVTSLAGGTPIAAGRIDNNYYATLTTVGQPIGEFYLLQDEGIFQTPLQVFTHAYQGPGIKPGDVKYKDVSGPKGVPDGIIDGNDRVFAGSPIPKFTYGLTGNLTYQDFDLSIFFQGAYGNKIYNQVLTDIEGFYRPFNITERVALHSWDGPGTSNTFPRLSWNGATNNKMPSTRFLEDGSYLRLKNIQLGYKFSDRLLSNLKVSYVRFFASVQNLLTFTKYTGLDPEMYISNNALGDGVKAVGIDWGTYPSSRTYTIGVNVNF